MNIPNQIIKNCSKMKVMLRSGISECTCNIIVKLLSKHANLQNPGKVNLLLKQKKYAFENKFEKSMVAATFAEAGEFDTAKNILNEEN